LDLTNAPGPQHTAELFEQTRVIRNERLVKRFAKLANALSWAVVLTAIAALIGYVADIQWLVTVRPGLQAMSPVTAVGLIALAAANLTQNRVVAWSTTVVPCAIALTMLIAHLVIGTDVISPVVSRWVSQAALPPAALTSVATASCLGLLAVAKALIFTQRDNAGEICAATALLIAGLGATGYLYDAKGLYSIYPFQTMALHTAICLVFLAAAFLMSSLGGWMAVVVSSSRAGSVTRRQLMLAATLPVIGWLLIYCIDRQIMSPSSAIALVVILMFTPLVILIVRDGTILTKYDEKQLAAELFENRIRARLQGELAAKVLELEHESAQRKAVEDSMHRAQRLEAMGQLTGGIAHDFNNLLMGISGNLELIKRKLPPDSGAVNNVARASQATEKGIKLTAQLLAFSRTQRLDVQALELAIALQSVRELIGTTLGPQVEVLIDVPNEDLWVQTDPLQFELAILNLALNARDAMPEGGLFTVRVVEPVHSSDRPSMVAVRVSDTGSGMSPEVMKKACEPFFTTKEHGKGTGLGLAQVYGLCRQCGGDLRISSEPGQGTVFELLLPLASAPTESTLYVAPAVASERQILQEPILVVDDDENVRSVMAEYLRSADYAVLEASNGSAALDILIANKCSAAVVDFLMPGMNGADFGRRAQLVQPGLPLIFVSGYSDTLALDAIGSAVVIRKPFELAQLVDALRSL
jgi:signal transduction histidine kinase